MANAATDKPVKTRKSDKAPDGMAFLGVRILRDTYKRLVRAKARMELKSGNFYGMGNLVERVLEDGLKTVENELGTSSSEL